MLLQALLMLATVCQASRPELTQTDEILSSFSYPGVSFRRAQPLSVLSSNGRKRQSGHMVVTRVPNTSTQDKGAFNRGAHSSASSLIALSPWTGQKGGFPGRQDALGNVSVVDHSATQYSVDVVINGSPMKLLVDSGSSDTWVRGADFNCTTTATSPVGQEQSACNLGPAYPARDFGDGQRVPGQHFYISLNDDEMVAGPLGYADVGLAGVTVPRQEVGLASVGAWRGDNVTSGVLGLAYPALTSAYRGDDVLGNRSEDLTTYSPLFTSMMVRGDVEPYWCLALNRNSSSGYISFGEVPPVDLSQGPDGTTDLIIADIAHKGSSGINPSFYTIIPLGFRTNAILDSSRYPFIIDSSTTMTYLPPSMAELVNSHFDPPAVYLWYYGSYFVPCDAVPPNLAVLIDGSEFFFDAYDMINQDMVDPLTGLCATTINSGNNGPFILGLSFLTSVMVQFNVGAGTITFSAREYHLPNLSPAEENGTITSRLPE
ncbi:hypothetical protein E8E14_013611 [Neopestalotiopsis sp. 37M]|nr:hypothetical protein E8E14_013611 [Neopestalotiopsis sp. 37M]